MNPPRGAGSGEQRLPSAEVAAVLTSASRTVLQPPGGELRHEGPVHLRQGQVPGPRLQVQCVQPAGVRGPASRADATAILKTQHSQGQWPRLDRSNLLPRPATRWWPFWSVELRPAPVVTKHLSHCWDNQEREGSRISDRLGMQFILLQEVLPPLCPGEHGRLPSGNPARLGEKESSIKEAGQPAWLSDMSAPDARVARAPCTELWGRAGSRRAQPCSGTGRSSVCNWSELGPSLPQEGDWEMQRRHSKGRPWTRHPADPTPYRALSKLRLQGRN
ncbi:cysteine-rich DPF motif domain-containing protein 1 isoform X2 [Neovison vison]|uniref:cysteine-rich DPF motif domain-containing protein 1 isoform X2 n=1 Tax=Neovison vison TaxID=452646 RepID=UPI001CF0D49F|nr:cysteine-rich DPF motif domain-containing protein 1 isoform X2 [Neogale vison]